MFLNFGSNTNYRHCFLGLIYFVALVSYGAAVKENDACMMRDSSPGICMPPQECETLTESGKQSKSMLKNFAICGFKGNQELVCCSSLVQTASPQTIKSNRNTDTAEIQARRPAEQACIELEYDPNLDISPNFHFPFMAALGYSQGAGEPYDYLCGGTLIHEKFVLTAVGCVYRFKLNVVRLGVSNIDDNSDEAKTRMDVPIKRIHIHPEYTPRDNTNNIALIELERAVPKSEHIRPMCLYTLADVPENSTVIAAGWDVTDYLNKNTSNIMFRRLMKIEPFSTCKRRSANLEFNQDYVCIIDDIYDLCMRGHGGPLILVNYTLNNFRQVGIIGSGFGCTLFYKLFINLDYIESVVWP